MPLDAKLFDCLVILYKLNLACPTKIHHLHQHLCSSTLDLGIVPSASADIDQSGSEFIVTVKFGFVIVWTQLLCLINPSLNLDLILSCQV